MGRTADDRLADIRLRQILGGASKWRAAEAVPQHLIESAADLAHRDGMSLADALRIVSGKSRLPYGTAKPV
ncbi:MAG: hypothetical protein EBQ96_09870 [Proteobacteria bacterium]|nr:hypothetical protein [Pseudomonadota bacterium]